MTQPSVSEKKPEKEEQTLTELRTNTRNRCLRTDALGTVANLVATAELSEWLQEVIAYTCRVAAKFGRRGTWRPLQTGTTLQRLVLVAHDTDKPLEPQLAFAFRRTSRDRHDATLAGADGLQTTHGLATVGLYECVWKAVTHQLLASTTSRKHHLHLKHSGRHNRPRQLHATRREKPRNTSSPQVWTKVAHFPHWHKLHPAALCSTRCWAHKRRGLA